MRTAAVVVARDRPDVLAATVEAIVSQSSPPALLIIVGNAPTSEVAAVMRAAIDAHRDGDAVVLRRNMGAAGGFAAGIDRALARGADRVVCFDDDATPDRDCVQALEAAADQLPLVGCVGAVAHDGSGRLSWPLWLLGMREPLHDLSEVRRLAAQRGPLAAHGLCWHGLLVPAQTIRDHGNVWAELFHQYEDAEFGLRLRRAGLVNYVVADALCQHPPAPAADHVGLLGHHLRITRQSPAKEYLTLRNDIVVRRRYNGVRFWYGTLPLILVRGAIICWRLGLPRATALRQVYLRAIGDALLERLGPPPPGLEELSARQA
jgi:GT2 family glycosyltransferase